MAASELAVATENIILHELTSEIPNRVIIPRHAGDGRTAFPLAGVAREGATPARSLEPSSPPSCEHSAAASVASPVAVQCRSAGLRVALSSLPERGGRDRDHQTRDSDSLASTGVQGLLAMEVPVERWPS